jgi:hypothetical protein
VPTDPKTMGLAGVAQVVRIHCHAQEVRQGKVVKETDDVRFAVTSYWPQEAGPQPLLDLTRDPLEHRKRTALSPGSDPGRGPLPRARHRGGP